MNVDLNSNITWSKPALLHGSDVFETIATYILGKNTGSINVSVQGKNLDALLKFTQKAKLEFVISDAELDEDALQEFVDFSVGDDEEMDDLSLDENAITIDYQLEMPMLSFSTSQPLVKLIARELEVERDQWLNPPICRLSSNGVNPVVTATAGKVFAGIKEFGATTFAKSGDIGSADKPLALPYKKSGSSTNYQLCVKGINGTNTIMIEW